MTFSDYSVEKKIPPAYDIDNQTLTMSVSSNSDNDILSFTYYFTDDVTTGYLFFYAISSIYLQGSYNIQVSVSDSIDSTSFIFTLTINSPPTISVLKSLSKVYDIDSAPISDQIDLISYFQISDVNIGDIVEFHLDDIPAWLSLQNGLTLLIHPDDFQSLGKTVIQIYAKDSFGENSLTPVNATFIFDRAPYYNDTSQLNQVLTCCDIEALTLPIPIDNLDTPNQIKVTLDPVPIWLTVLNSGKLYVDTSKITILGSNPFNIVLTDTLGLSRNYSGSITLNHRPEWTVGQPPANNVSVMSGGEIKCVEYGSIFSSDPDSDSYKVKIQLPTAGLPQGLNVRVVNLTNITVHAQPGLYNAGNYKIEIILEDIHGGLSLTQQNLTISVEADPSKPLPLAFQVNRGPPFFVGQDHLSDITMQIGAKVKKLLPEIDDPDFQDSWSISIENYYSSGLYQFASLSYPILTLSPWDSSHAGFYLVSLILKDSRGKSSRYSFNLAITDPLFMNSNNSSTLENDLAPQNDTIETIQDLDSNIFQLEDSDKKVPLKKVHLPRRVIPEKTKLSQELMARISNINSIGDLTVQFNRDVKIPTYYNSFNQSILEITLINKTQTKLRVLDANETIEVNNEEKKLQFRWEIKSFSSRKITFKIDFEDPLEISQEYSNYLQIKFLQNGYFQDKFTGKSIGLNFSTSEKVPKQMIPQNSAAVFLSKNAETIGLVLATTLQANFIINILLSSTLQFLWGMINILQIIVRLPLLNLKFPANSKILFSILLDITNFQFFDYLPLQEAVFNFSQTQPINQQFEDMGYTTVNAIQNLGMVFYTLVFILIVYAMIFLIRAILRLMNANADLIISKIEVWLRKQLLYNTLIRFFIESYIEILISSMLQFHQFANQTSGDRFSGFIGVTLAILCTLMPFILIFFIRKYHSLIKTKDPKLDPINTIFANLSTSSPATLYYTAFFMLRRLLFTLSIIFMNYIPMLQIFFLFVSSLATIIYLIYVKPFDSPLLNRLEIFNELCLYLMSYPCLFFTDISIEDVSGSLTSPSLTHFKYNMGWLVIGVVLLNIGVNMFIMFAITIRMAWRTLSSRKCRKQKERKQSVSSEQCIQRESFSQDATNQKKELIFEEEETVFEERKEQVCSISMNYQENQEEAKDQVQFTVKVVKYSEAQSDAPQKIIVDFSSEDNSVSFIGNQTVQELSAQDLEQSGQKENKAQNRKTIKLAASRVQRENEIFYPQALLVDKAKVVKIAPQILNEKRKK